MAAQTAQPLSTSPLESMPPEIRRQILFRLDLDGVFTIIQASPTFYQQYLIDRTAILRSSLQHTLGGAVIVARTLHQFNRARTHDIETPEMDEACEDFHHFFAASHWPPPADVQLTDDEVVDLVAEYRALFRPVVEKYVKWALDSLARDTGTEAQPRSPITQTERTRILRAFYRFQLCCVMFGPEDEEPRRRHKIQYILEDLKIRNILNMLVPWEVEQLVSVYYFAELEYERIFDSIESDLQPEHPRCADQVRSSPPTRRLYLGRGRSLNFPPKCLCSAVP